MKKYGKFHTRVYSDIGHVEPTDSPPPPEPGKMIRGPKYYLGSMWYCKSSTRSFMKGSIVTVVSGKQKKKQVVVLVKDSSGKVAYIPTKYLHKLE